MKFRLTLLCVVALSVLGACTKPAPPEEPIRAVKLLTVQSDALSAAQEFSGEVRARIESRLGFRVAGKITAHWLVCGLPLVLLAPVIGLQFDLPTDAIGVLSTGEILVIKVLPSP